LEGFRRYVAKVEMGSRLEDVESSCHIISAATEPCQLFERI
jgi:hypothetical protein